MRQRLLLAPVIVLATIASVIALARCDAAPPLHTALVRASATTAPPTTMSTIPPTTTTTQPSPPPTTAPHVVARRVATAPVRRHSSAGHWHPGGPCPSPSQCPQLRACENGGSYSHGTSSQYDGAYQFDHGSQWGMTPAQQDARADAMYADRGADPWPRCGRYLQ
jgi:hypothetical protein